jgi:predicted amidohydrolase
MKKKLKAAAVQINAKIADSPANIESCKRLALAAVKDGATWIALPEFFNTGVSWNK